MGECHDFLVQCIKRKHPVLNALVAFAHNYPCAIQEHALDETSRPLLPLFIADANKHNHSRLNKHVPLLWNAQGKASLQYIDWWTLDVRVPRHRLMLLEPPLLKMLTLWCGLVIHRKEIATIIDRATVLELRKAVGEEGHRFALRRTALLPGVRELPVPQTVKKSFEQDDTENHLVVRMQKSGEELVSRCLADLPSPLQETLQRLVPQHFAATLATCAKNPLPDMSTRHWPLVRTLLFKEVAPQWEPCFS